MQKLMIDLETKSDVDITKAGVYRYADSPYFDILLFAYSVDDAPVQVVDLACGERLPEEILNALTDDRIQKHAFNASFERVCLSVWLRRNYPEHFVEFIVAVLGGALHFQSLYAFHQGEFYGHVVVGEHPVAVGQLLKLLHDVEVLHEVDACLFGQVHNGFLYGVGGVFHHVQVSGEAEVL